MSQLWSDPWIEAILAAAVRGAPLVLLAAAAAIGWRRSSAAARHLMWLVAIASMLALPLLSASLPVWRVAVLPPTEAVASVSEQPVVTLPAARPAPIAPARISVAAPAPVGPISVGEPTTPRDWGRIAFFAWCLGASLVALPMLLGHVRVWRLSKTARPASGGAWGALASVLPASVGLGDRVRVMVSDRATMPMAFGIVNPTVLLPADAEQWPIERRRDVLLHELAHVARRDCLTQLIAQAACALYWFDPLVWLASRALRGERERACDDAVVCAGARPSDYATHLLQVARDLRVPRTTALATVCMARRSQLSERLLAILDERRNRRTVSRRFAVPAWLIALLILIPAAAFVPSRALGTFPVIVSAIVPSEGMVAERRPITRGTSASRNEVGRVFTASDLLGQPTQCDYGKKGNTSVSRNSDDEKETWRAHISAGDCDVTIRAIGKVRFASDLSDVQSVPANGSFLLTESDALTTRRIEIRADDGGRMTRKFTVDGVERPWDDEGRRWLATVLVALERRTAFTADTRVPALYKEGGVDAVLREIALLSGDHARRRYFEALFEASPTTPDAEAMTRLLNVADDIESDFELAQLLVEVSDRGLASAATRDAYFKAVGTIESDFERRRVLSSILKRADNSEEVQKSLLQAASGIESDFELASFLVAFAAKYPDMSTAVREGFMKTADSIDSEHEYGRVMQSVRGNARRASGMF